MSFVGLDWRSLNGESSGQAPPNPLDECLRLSRGQGIPTAATISRPRRLLLGLVVGSITVAVGQAFQILLGPYSRLQGTYIRQTGIAALAPDSDYYLRSSSSFAMISDAPWTNWSYLVIGRLGHATGDAATALAVLQLFVAIGISAALYTVARDIAGVVAGWAAAAAFAINPLTAQWFRFVTTEAFFFSIVIAIVLIGGGAQVTRRSSTDPLLLGIGALAAFMRPNGVLVLLSVLAIIVLRRMKRHQARIAIVALVLIAPLLLAAGLRATGGPAEGSLVSQFYNGIVIEGTSDVQFSITMPPAQDVTDESLSGAVAYASEHPVASARLFFTRIGTEVAQVRPHYPFALNVAAGFAIMLYLAGAVIGLRQTCAASLRRPALILVGPILALVGLTFATPEARYGWGALVALTPFVGVGVARCSMLGRRASALRQSQC